jgi:hypothetical protein
MKQFVLILLLLSPGYFFGQSSGTWVEVQTQAVIVLNPDGSFQYSDVNQQFEGMYGIQGNVLTMQDIFDNVLQYSILSSNSNQFTLMDASNNFYDFHRQGADQSAPLPWKDERYNKDLATNEGMALKESETQVYVSFMQLLIGKQLTSEEVAEIRNSNISDFKQNPQIIKNDVIQTESAMRQIYASNSPDVVAYFREELISALFQSAEQNEELNDSPLMKIYNRHVQILQHDAFTHLSLSSQDVDAYIKYLQFQNMLMGQSYTVSPEEGQMLRVQLVNSFNSLPQDQKQSLAYASFIWNVVEQQWAGLTPEQQQYISQIQNQMNLQNVSVSPQQVEESMKNQGDYSEDIQALVDKSKAEAEAKGMSVQEYLNYKQQKMNADSNMFTMMQNTMTENHATMLNVINNMGDGDDGYYYVDYSGN